MNLRSRSLGGLVLAAGFLLLAATPLFAATCSVPSGGHPSIHSAINDSTCATINVAPGTYFENLIIRRSVTINGDASSPTVVNGQGFDWVVLTEGGGYTITLSHLTLTNGNESLGGGMNIDGSSTVNMNYCTVSGNTATSPNGAGEGGGIFSVSGTLNLFNSTVANNTAEAGSPCAAPGRDTPCGISPGQGGGIWIDGGTLTAVNSTIADNVAGDGASPATGVGIFEVGSVVSLTNTLVAGNTHGASLSNCNKNVTDDGYNKSDDATCGLTGTGSAQNVGDLNLGPLASNGGPTQTIALLPGSAAIDQIASGTNGCGTTVTSDQRGLSRPQNGSCDIGAFEVCATALNVTIHRGGPTTICAGTSTPLTAYPSGSGYAWFKNGLPAPGTNDEQTYYATQTGKYTVTVTNAYGCTETSSLAMPVTVLNDPAPTITVVGPTSVPCHQTVTLNAPAGMTHYQWYNCGVPINGATSHSYVAMTSGWYSVAVTNAQGCSGTSSQICVKVSCAH